jgi:phage antirepressor YoqD-like protein
LNDLQIFKSDEFGQVRTVAFQGKTYFVAGDIAKALGYVNIQDAIKKHCRWVAKCDVPHPQSPSKTLEVNIIPIGDIYRLAAHSELPSSEKFETWIFDTVIPSIHKNGGYILNQENLTPEQIVANALIVAQNIIQQKDKQIADMKPKADYFDELIERNLLTNFRDTAKELHIKEKDFISFLISRKYVYRDGKRKIKPYADKNNGLFEVKEFTRDEYAGNQTLITPKGRETFRLLIRGI